MRLMVHGATSYSQYGQIIFSQIQIGTVPLLVDETLQVQCPACEGQLGGAAGYPVSSLQCVVTVNTALGPQVEVQYTVRWVQVGAGGCGS